MRRDQRQGIQSIEVGMRLLDAFSAAEGEMTLSALGAAAGMHPSKAHRYLVSLIRAGYVEQNPVTGRYNLGPRALHVGLAALRQLNLVRLGEGIASDLRDATGHTISMVVWANHGPTVVRVSESTSSITLTVRVGSVLPLLTSANGQLFLAYMPRSVTQPFIAAELKKPVAAPKAKIPRTIEEVEQIVTQVRRHGMARNDQQVTPGLVSLAAPIFDHRQELAGTIAIVAPAGTLDLSWSGAPARMLAAAARKLAERLGASGAPSSARGKTTRQSND